MLLIPRGIVLGWGNISKRYRLTEFPSTKRTLPGYSTEAGAPFMPWRKGDTLHRRQSLSTRTSHTAARIRCRQKVASLAKKSGNSFLWLRTDGPTTFGTAPARRTYANSSSFLREWTKRGREWYCKARTWLYFGSSLTFRHPSPFLAKQRE